MLVGFIMAEEDMSKTWEKAEKMLAKGNATGALICSGKQTHQEKAAPL